MAKKATQTMKKTPPIPTAKKPAIKAAEKPRTKTQVIDALAELSGTTKKEVAALLDAMSDLIRKDLGKGGPESFTLPGLLKIRVQKVPARKARQGTNPATGEPMMFKAKPATKKVKVMPLKALKEMI